MEEFIRKELGQLIESKEGLYKNIYSIHVENTIPGTRIEARRH